MSRNHEGKSSYEKRAIRRETRKLHEAVKENDLPKLQELLTSHTDVNFHYGGQTALQIAVKLGHLAVSESLIKHGADVNKCDAEDNSLLNMAAKQGHTDVVRLLVNNKADLSLSNVLSSTALNTAAFKGYADIVRILVTQEDCDINRPNKYGQTPLCIAAKKGHKDTVKVLLTTDADLNWFDNEKRTPLITAVEKGNEEIAKRLITAGCDLNAQDRYGCTALWYAAQQGLNHTVHLLVDSEADLNRTDNRGSSPFMEAVKSVRLDTVTLLAESGCDINLTEHDTKQAAINIAVRMAAQVFGESEKLLSLVKLLISVGCDINHSDKSGWTPLYHAAFGGELDIVKCLVEHKVNVTVVTEDGETALHGAAYGNKPNIVKMLIEAGCNVNAVDKKNRLPLYTATSHKSRLQILELLLSSDSQTDICETEEGLSPIFMAIQQHYTEAVHLLIQYKADVNTPNKAGDTPLWVACEKGLADIVEVLLKHPKIDVDKGVSHVPLHAAVLHGFESIVYMLLKAGCNVNKLTDICSSALYFAADADNTHLAKLLLYYGANPSAPYNVTLPQKCCRMYSDPHPHLELEPLQCAIRNNSFMMAMIILTGSPRMPYQVLNTLRDLLFRTNYAKDARLSQNLIVNYAKFFSQILHHPRSLRDSCRGIIREAIGDRPFGKVGSLPIPQKIQDFLCLQDLPLWQGYSPL